MGPPSAAWFVAPCSSGDEGAIEEGPFTLTELAERWHTAGWTTETVLLWQEGMQEWQPLHLLNSTEVADALASPQLTADQTKIETERLHRETDELNNRLIAHRSERRRAEQSWLRAKTASREAETRSNKRIEASLWVTVKRLAEEEDAMTLRQEQLSTDRDMLEAQLLRNQAEASYRAQLQVNAAHSSGRDRVNAELVAATERAAAQAHKMEVMKAEAKKEMRQLAKLEKQHDDPCFKASHRDLLRLAAVTNTAQKAWDAYRVQQQFAGSLENARRGQERNPTADSNAEPSR